MKRVLSFLFSVVGVFGFMVAGTTDLYARDGYSDQRRGHSSHGARGHSQSQDASRSSRPSHRPRVPPLVSPANPSSRTHVPPMPSSRSSSSRRGNSPSASHLSHGRTSPKSYPYNGRGYDSSRAYQGKHDDRAKHGGGKEGRSRHGGGYSSRDSHNYGQSSSSRYHHVPPKPPLSTFPTRTRVPPMPLVNSRSYHYPHGGRGYDHHRRAYRSKDIYRHYYRGSYFSLNQFFYFDDGYANYGIESIVLIGAGGSASNVRLYIDGHVVDSGRFYGPDHRIVLYPRSRHIVGHDVYRARVYLEDDVYINQVIVNFREPRLQQVTLDRQYHGSGLIDVLDELGLPPYYEDGQLPWVELLASGRGRVKLYIDGFPVGDDASVDTFDRGDAAYINADKIRFSLPARYSDLGRVGRMEIKVWGNVRAHTLSGEVLD